MDLSIGTLFGQILGLIILGIVVYMVVLIPISLKKISRELAAIKNELRKQNGQSVENQEDREV